MEPRRPDEPAPDADHHRDEDAAGVPPTSSVPPDAEQRPIGALFITGFLTLTILVSWYGMYALNMVRN